MKTLIEFIGWYGVVAIVLAYALVSFSVLSSSNIYYQLLNITGALGIAVDSYYKKDYQPVVLNVIWMAIAALAIVRIFY